MKIEELLKDHELGNSDFQDYFLVTVRAGGTTWGMYKQTLRELYKRLRGLREVWCDLQIARMDIPEASSERSRIERIRALLRFEESERSMQNLKREIRIFYNLAKHLKSMIGEVDEKRRWSLEYELWEYRAREMVALDIGSGHAFPSANTLEHLAALPVEIRQSALDGIKDGKIVKWYSNQGRELLLPSIHELEEIPIDDELELLFDSIPALPIGNTETIAPAKDHKDTV